MVIAEGVQWTEILGLLGRVMCWCVYSGAGGLNTQIRPEGVKKHGTGFVWMLGAGAVLGAGTVYGHTWRGTVAPTSGGLWPLKILKLSLKSSYPPKCTARLALL